MANDTPGLRHLPIRIIRWLGHDIVEGRPLVRMLHESRAAAAARENKLPLAERPSYQIRRRRVFARGRSIPGIDDAPVQPGEDRASLG